MKFECLNENPIRIDKFLSDNLSNFSREKLKELIKNGLCRVNNKENIQPSCSVSMGDVVEIDLPKNDSFVKKSLHVNEDFDVEILFENENYAIINKPAGITVHKGSGSSEGLLTNILSLKFDELSSLRGEDRAGIVHRIDKDTTGCLIIAKNDTAHFKLAEMIKNKTLRREYLAICHGTPMPFKGTVNTFIDKDKKHFGRMCINVHGEGKNAITEYEVKHIFFNGDFSLVKFRLQTGRTHQIRLHSKHIGHSVVGDGIYAVKNLALQSYPNTSKDILSKVYECKRQMLHAFKLSFECPFEKKKIVCVAGLPDDFKGLGKILSDKLDFSEIYAKII